MSETQEIIVYKDYKCVLQFARYTINNAVCIDLVDAETGEPIATATVNIVERDYPFPQLVIKEYEYEGMTQTLVDADIIHFMTNIEIGPFNSKGSLCFLTSKGMLMVMKSFKKNG